MSRLAVFASLALVWFGVSVVTENIAYIHMITGAGTALAIHWGTK